MRVSIRPQPIVTASGFAERKVCTILTQLMAGLLVCLTGVLFAGDQTLHSGSPKDAGMSGKRLDDAVLLFQKAVREDELRGAVLLVARRGVVVLHEAVGWRNHEAGQPMLKDTLFRLASNTKPVIATAVLTLAEKEKLTLTDNVRDHIPSWDNYRSGFIKVHHLLSHTSGLRYPVVFMEPLIAKGEDYPDAPSLRAEVDRFGRLGAREIPGTTYYYSNPGFNTLGRLIEVVTQQRLEEYLRKEIYKPLNMNDTWNYEAHAPQDRMARVYRRNETKWEVTWSPGDGPDWPFVRASGGMISTAWDYATFCQMYLNEGMYDGRRILSAVGVRLATENQTHLPMFSTSPDRASLLGLRTPSYGFGWSIGPDGSYSHAGSDGTYAWVDPRRELLGIIFTQSVGGARLRETFRETVNDACWMDEGG